MVRVGGRPPSSCFLPHFQPCANKRKPSMPPNQGYKMPCLSSLSASTFPGPTTSNQSIPKAYPFFTIRLPLRAPLVVQWLRICLPVQGTPGLGGSHMPQGNQPVHHIYWASVPRVPALQKEKPPRWEAHAATRESPHAAMKMWSGQPKINT